MTSTLPPNESGAEEMRRRILDWDLRLDAFDYFELLSVDFDANPEDVDAAYLRFARVFHPDSHPDAPAELRAALTRVFQRGVEARQVLSDTELARQYRALLAKGILRLTDHRKRALVDFAVELPRLHERCRSAGAKLEAAQAARAWQRGDFRRVERHLVAALRFDGDANPDIEQCLAASATLPEPTS